MSRSFSALDLITLPRLSSASAAALGQELIAVACEQPSLPPAVTPAFELLEQRHASLRASRKFMNEVQASDSAAVADADQWLDASWGAFNAFLQGWARLPARGEAAAGQAERARRLLEGIFPGWLRFVKLPYKIEWAETQTRLDRLGEPDYAELVKALGGGAFVASIAEAFRAYDAALKMSERKAEAKAGVGVREPLAQFTTALRGYVLHVTAHGHAAGEGSAGRALAEALLAPLAAWPSSGGARKGKPGAEPAPPAPGDETPIDAG